MKVGVGGVRGGGGGVEGEEMKVAIYLGEWETVVLNVDNAREERGR